MTIVDLDPRIIAMLDLLAEMDAGTYVDLHDYDGRKIAAVELWAKSRNVGIERTCHTDGLHRMHLQVSHRVTVVVHDMQARQERTVIDADQMWSPT